MSEDICAVCKRETWEDRYSKGCSEFCQTVTTEDIALFLAMKPGDYGLWPCAECGCVIEDSYVVGGVCSRCSPKVQLRRCYLLLGEALPHVPAEMADRIRLLLGRE